MNLQDLASGQANIGTPLRSRLDSQDSRLFTGMKHDDNVTPAKDIGRAFMSPNVGSKLASHVDQGLYGTSAGVLGARSGLTASGRKNQTSEFLKKCI